MTKMHKGTHKSSQNFIKYAWYNNFRALHFIVSLFLPAAKPAGQWMTISLHVALSDLRHFRGKIDTGALVIEVTDFKSEVRCDL